MAEAGPGPDFQLRAILAAPIALGSGLLIVGGKSGYRLLEAGVARSSRVGQVAFAAAAVLGVIAALYALVILFAWT
jgi:hypothetical protein